MTPSVIRTQLISHEGLRLKPYRCTSGKLTIGVGRNLEARGLSEEEALLLLDNDIAICVNDLQEIFAGSFWRSPEIVQRVLIDMRFNLGSSGFRGFKKMIKAVKAHDFNTAAVEMQDSNWFVQVKDRGITLVEMMLKAA